MKCRLHESPPREPRVALEREHREAGELRERRHDHARLHVVALIPVQHALERGGAVERVPLEPRDRGA